MAECKIRELDKAAEYNTGDGNRKPQEQGRQAYRIMTDTLQAEKKQTSLLRGILITNLILAAGIVIVGRRGRDRDCRKARPGSLLPEGEVGIAIAVREINLRRGRDRSKREK